MEIKGCTLYVIQGVSVRVGCCLCHSPSLTPSHTPFHFSHPFSHTFALTLIQQAHAHAYTAVYLESALELGQVSPREVHSELLLIYLQMALEEEVEGEER